jgi:hypothetical protein
VKSAAENTSVQAVATGYHIILVRLRVMEEMTAYACHFRKQQACGRQYHQRRRANLLGQDSVLMFLSQDIYCRKTSCDTDSLWSKVKFLVSVMTFRNE